MASAYPRSFTSPSRKRNRSPSPNSFSDGYGNSKRNKNHDLSVDVCKDFTRLDCHRSEFDCKFAHPHSSVTIENYKVTACGDALRKKCFRGSSCRYYHPPPHIQETLLKVIGIEEVKVEQVCRDFLRGSCLRTANECRFAHHAINASLDDCAVACQDFLHGRCERKSCRYSHSQVHMTQVKLHQYGAVTTLPNPSHNGNHDEHKPVCKDFLMKKCHRDDCKFAHPGSPSRPEVCQDFLRGLCDRRSCRYSHNQVHTTPQVRLQQYGAVMGLPSPPYTGNDEEDIPVCKDFLMKKCHRDDCKYAHPGSPSQPKVCQDFLRGRCDRRSCRYSHSQVHITPQVRLHQYGAVMGLPSPPYSGNGMMLDEEHKPVCKDFLMKKCHRDDCKFAHPGSPSRPEVCQDFLRGRCDRKSCRYSHRQLHMTPQVNSLQYGAVISPPSSPLPRTVNDKDFITVCKDFLNKRCNRGDCKYAHPSFETQVIDNKVKVCRDFTHGVCHRPICRFYHSGKQS